VYNGKKIIQGRIWGGKICLFITNKKKKGADESYMKMFFGNLFKTEEGNAVIRGRFCIHWFSIVLIGIYLLGTLIFFLSGVRKHLLSEYLLPTAALLCVLALVCLFVELKFLSDKKILLSFLENPGGELSDINDSEQEPESIYESETEEENG